MSKEKKNYCNGCKVGNCRDCKAYEITDCEDCFDEVGNDFNPCMACDGHRKLIHIDGEYRPIDRTGGF